jgi:hypothetical protein
VYDVTYSEGRSMRLRIQPGDVKAWRAMPDVEEVAAAKPKEPEHVSGEHTFGDGDSGWDAVQP